MHVTLLVAEMMKMKCLGEADMKRRTGSPSRDSDYETWYRV